MTSRTVPCVRYRSPCVRRTSSPTILFLWALAFILLFSVVTITPLLIFLLIMRLTFYIFHTTLYFLFQALALGCLALALRGRLGLKPFGLRPWPFSSHRPASLSRRRWGGVALREDDAGGRAEAHDRAAGEEDGGGLGLGLGFAHLT